MKKYLEKIELAPESVGGEARTLRVWNDKDARHLSRKLKASVEDKLRVLRNRLGAKVWTLDAWTGNSEYPQTLNTREQWTLYGNGDITPFYTMRRVVRIDEFEDDRPKSGDIVIIKGSVTSPTRLSCVAVGVVEYFLPEAAQTTYGRYRCYLDELRFKYGTFCFLYDDMEELIDSKVEALVAELLESGVSDMIDARTAGFVRVRDFQKLHPQVWPPQEEEENPRLFKGKLHSSAVGKDPWIEVRKVGEEEWLKVPIQHDSDGYFCMDFTVPVTFRFKSDRTTLNDIFEEIDAIPWTKEGTMPRQDNEAGYLSDLKNLRRANLSGCDSSTTPSMIKIFQSCENLEYADIHGLFSPKGYRNGILSAAFHNCNKLKSVNISNCVFEEGQQDIYHPFHQCYDIEEVDFGDALIYPGWLGAMLYECTKLHTIRIGTWDFSKFSVFYGDPHPFWQNKSLTNVIGTVKNMAKSFSLKSNPLISVESAMVFINGLAEVEVTQTIGFSPKTYDALTAGQIAVATSKGWTVVREDW